jgi:CheY-like chemotaxis protein
MAAGQPLLLVEDEPILRELWEILLEEEGFDVTVAEDGRSAIEALDNTSQPISIMVTDINLGSGPDGWEVARQGRARDAALAVVYITGAGGHERQFKAVANSRLLTKPFTPEQLVEAIFSLLHH